MLHTYIKSLDHIFGDTCDRFLRDAANGIFSIHFQSFYASLSVFVHAFFDKTPPKVCDVDP
jgi:hypothetical protein